MNTKQTRHAFLFIIWLSMVALACNLTSNPNNIPPTLVPAPPGVTPQPTLGYATPIGGVQPPVNGDATTNNTIDVELYNLINEVEVDRLLSHVYSLEGFYTRHVNSSQTDPNRGVGAAANYILNQFQTIASQSNGNFTAFPQQFNAFYNGERTSQRNIVGLLNGTEAGAGIVIIGAHYDSRTDDLDDATGFAPGADDNGSGVAAVIEMARILSTRPMRSSVIFVLFAAEEVGRQGSEAFVELYIEGRGLSDQVIAMLNVDTVGSNNTSTGIVNDYQIRMFSDDDNTNQSAARHLARAIEFIGINHSLPLEIDMKTAADREGRYGDHFSFTERGYPAIRFIEAVEDTYNREGRDTREHIEPDYFMRTTQTILTVLKAIADGPRPPRQLVLRDTGTQDTEGNTQYSLIWDAVPGASSYMVALRRAGSPQYDQSFVWPTTQTDPWSGFGAFEAVAIAAIDESGLVGPMSQEFIIRR